MWILCNRRGEDKHILLLPNFPGGKWALSSNPKLKILVLPNFTWVRSMCFKCASPTQLDANLVSDFEVDDYEPFFSSQYDGKISKCFPGEHNKKWHGSHRFLSNTHSTSCSFHRSFSAFLAFKQPQSYDVIVKLTTIFSALQTSKISKVYNLLSLLDWVSFFGEGESSGGTWG